MLLHRMPIKERITQSSLSHGWIVFRDQVEYTYLSVRKGITNALGL